MEGYAVSTSTPEGYIGKPIDELPTPAVIIDRFKVESNIEQMAKTVSDWQCLFRAHIKTHKTKQGTALQLSTGNHAIIVSTLAEAWGLVHSGLIEKGTVDDVSKKNTLETDYLRLSYLNVTFLDLVWNSSWDQQD